MPRENLLPRTVAEMVEEDHLHLAFLLDLLEDELSAGQPVAGRLAQLRRDFGRHAIRTQQVLERHRPELLEDLRLGHERMSALLLRMSAELVNGVDIQPTLDQILALFTGQLLPANKVFKEMRSIAP
ncbi:MAG: hypothetical protein NVV74_22165 [Magnetospirillum sp.]|nr:hypothetical protein [Magnetospirillum sp.]